MEKAEFNGLLKKTIILKYFVFLPIPILGRIT